MFRQEKGLNGRLSDRYSVQSGCRVNTAIVWTSPVSLCAMSLSVVSLFVFVCVCVCVFLYVLKMVCVSVPMCVSLCIFVSMCVFVYLCLCVSLCLTISYCLWVSVFLCVSVISVSVSVFVSFSICFFSLSLQALSLHICGGGVMVQEWQFDFVNTDVPKLYSI